MVAASLGLFLVGPLTLHSRGVDPLDAQLTVILRDQGFTGRIESTLAGRLGRPLDTRLADVGRLLWFDTITGLNGDNTCGGCHSPTHGFGDSQSIAIGIENNGIVGPHRAGPRNMRRAPMVLNTAFFPALMWNSRFRSLSGDPFNNRAGFLFPLPEGTMLSGEPHLLVAQAFIPPTERTEVAGFVFQGDNDAIRAEVVRRLNNVPAYRREFASIFPRVRRGAAIDFGMFSRAIAEFEFSLTFADSPLDHYARGQISALDASEKRGALLFFGKAGCVQCHSVGGASNEMFTDFRDHVIATPQLVPHVTNNQFDGTGADEDFGREEVTGVRGDRYKFRTPPLRNVAVVPALMHDGAFTSLADTIRHHLNPAASLRAYDPASQALPADLRGPIGPTGPLIAALDARLSTPVVLTTDEFDDLLQFVRDALLDERATPQRLRGLVPQHVPSDNPTLEFEFSAP
jgi:cytochrome c peroxidase